jgi:hypothetical protein
MLIKLGNSEYFPVRLRVFWNSLRTPLYSERYLPYISGHGDWGVAGLSPAPQGLSPLRCSVMIQG